jgi:hypothetical protein
MLETHTIGDPGAQLSNGASEALAISGGEGMAEDDDIEITIFEKKDRFFNRDCGYDGIACGAQNQLARV